MSSLNNLGLIAPIPERAALFTRALALKPDYVDALVNLGNHLVSEKMEDSATEFYLRALSFEPDRADVLCALGGIYNDRGEYEAAGAYYNRAANLKPDDIALLYAVGRVFALISMTKPDGEEAAKTAALWYERLLTLVPDLEFPNMFMAQYHETRGRVAASQMYRSRVPRPQPLSFETSENPRRNVLILSGAGGGNVPYDTLVPKATNSRIKWQIEYATDEQEDELPPYDVVFNVIGNADVIGESLLARLNRFQSHCQRRFLNSPEAVVRTRRDLMPSLLEGIPNVVVPSVTRVTRDELDDSDLMEKLAERGIACPFLIRPICGQGGMGIHLITNFDEIKGMEFHEADDFYCINYSDYKNDDGYYRKYRTIYVDKVPHHYHLAISKQWLVHYFSADMLAEPWKREEERRFLEAPDTVLNPISIAAINAIGERMGLDFCGIDYSLMDDGRVLVFEANATMLVYPANAVDFPYKVKPVQTIFDNVDIMLGI